jgi:hypothetical protein
MHESYSEGYEKIFINGDLVRTWKEAVVALLTPIFHIIGMDRQTNTAKNTVSIAGDHDEISPRIEFTTLPLD